MADTAPEMDFDERLLHPAATEHVCPVYTVPLHEMRLLDFCRQHAIVSYLPLRRAWRVKTHNRGNRQYTYRNEVLRPMFPSYLFAKMNADQRAALYSSGDVVRIIGVADQPRLLAELQVVHQVEQIGMTTELEFNPGLCEGDKFLIESGPWQGITGWLTKKEKRFLWSVEIESVGTIIRATLDPSQYKLTKLENN